MPSTGTPSSNTACGATRRLRFGHRFRAAGENDAARAESADFGVADVPGMDLAVDAAFAHAPRDQLRVLRAEVENQDAMRVDVRWVQGSRGSGRPIGHFS